MNPAVMLLLMRMGPVVVSTDYTSAVKGFTDNEPRLNGRAGVEPAINGFADNNQRIEGYAQLQ